MDTQLGKTPLEKAIPCHAQDSESDTIFWARSPGNPDGELQTKLLVASRSRLY